MTSALQVQEMLAKVWGCKLGPTGRATKQVIQAADSNTVTDFAVFSMTVPVGDTIKMMEYN